MSPQVLRAELYTKNRNAQEEFRDGSTLPARISPATTHGRAERGFTPYREALLCPFNAATTPRPKPPDLGQLIRRLLIRSDHLVQTGFVLAERGRLLRLMGAI